MGMQFYASPEQIMRDRSEYARKGIARGRNVVVSTYVDGVLCVAENPSSALHKVSEIYDRIAFAAVGKYNEFENLRVAGVRLADLRGYSYDRKDVTGRGLANAYAQTLGSIFTEQPKPYEVEICVAEVGATPDDDQLYRITYNGSVADEPGFVAMGGHSEQIATRLRENHRDDQSLQEALRLAVEALAGAASSEENPRKIDGDSLEVALLDRTRRGRTFRRLTGTKLQDLLGPMPDAPAQESPTTETPTTETPATEAPADPATDRPPDDPAGAEPTAD